jgi:hypothetical protein
VQGPCVSLSLSSPSRVPSLQQTREELQKGPCQEAVKVAELEGLEGGEMTPGVLQLLAVPLQVALPGTMSGRVTYQHLSVSGRHEVIFF